ncbi:MAG: aminotransferase class V-fold PLP-dependent enzyme [Candidatus Promineifilaceae bacterium]
MDELAELFLLDPDVRFLNHGSFGATPRPVFEAYQIWQRRLERQPVHFFSSELGGYLAEARQSLGDFINADADDLVYVPNATFGLNVIARSLELGPSDEVLASDHEYGACQNVWAFLSGKRGFRYVTQPISLPFGTPEEILEQFWDGVTSQTKVIFISHITSPTAVILPVEAICARAREAGILTVIDGAHTLGQLDLDMVAIDADFYLSNGHKWLCSPKGSAFLYARRDRQHLVEPLVVGWGWGSNRSISYGSDFLDAMQWLGTDDLSAYLAVPAAIRFQEEHNWTAVREACHLLLSEALKRICDLTELANVYPRTDYYRQVAIAPLPLLRDFRAMKAELYDTYCVEVPLVEWNGRDFIRVSVQGYNSQADIDALLAALQDLLPRHVA